MANIQVTALALSNWARVHSCELTQRMRASVMRLHRPTFLPIITDSKRQSVLPIHEAAEASETLLWSRTNWGRERGGCSSSGSRRTAAAAAGPAGAVGIEERLAGDT